MSYDNWLERERQRVEERAHCEDCECANCQMMREEQERAFERRIAEGRKIRERSKQ